MNNKSKHPAGGKKRAMPHLRTGETNRGRPQDRIDHPPIYATPRITVTTLVAETGFAEASTSVTKSLEDDPWINDYEQQNEEDIAIL